MRPKTTPLVIVPSIPTLKCSTLVISKSHHLEAITNALAEFAELPAGAYHLSDLDYFTVGVSLALNLKQIIVHQEMFPFGLQNILEMLEALHIMFAGGYSFPNVYLVSDDEGWTQKAVGISGFYRGEMTVCRMDGLPYAIVSPSKKRVAQ